MENNNLKKPRLTKRRLQGLRLFSIWFEGSELEELYEQSGWKDDLEKLKAGIEWIDQMHQYRQDKKLEYNRLLDEDPAMY